MSDQCIEERRKLADEVIEFVKARCCEEDARKILSLALARFDEQSGDNTFFETI